ncbi:cardiolipin synthase A [Hafnia alvei]|jgi:cardiolipin synthase|uniref:Cardiolipin synthase A n=3 Tax=Hafnia alvei TaxID=569 RepID=A0A097R2W6_HAFAL|nr:MULTISPECIES: cardiolipin synthase [Hafnia]AIU73072.1 cardiolipin synthetase [Hafnia alvei FB1]AWV45129.1 cardiolipin synthase A [Hafnia alvei]KFC86540.1 cardiolipin synthetase [Hafnia alvei ATCC 13337]KID01197.2 cardiolipin synthetase [Hafnia alvei]KKI44924.1 cardiolipin synthetase [Hafnia alvei]
MTTFYTVISWLTIFGYWLLIASVTLRILMKRRAVPSAMAWLLIIYILPLVGIIAYLSFGELHLGKRRAERAKAMWPSTAHWLADLKSCKSIFATGNSEVAAPLFQLCERRQGIAGVRGNQLQLLTTSDDTLKALIRDIELARSNIEMVFYIWQPGGLADQVAESLMAAARRGVHCRLLLDSAGSVTFFRSPYPAMMRNAGVEVVEALKVNLMRVFLRRMDLRQHRKVVLIDNFIAYTGSMNLVDPRFFKQDAGVGQWIDVMARMEGPVATTMGIIFSCDWEIETGKRILPPEPEYHSLPFEEESGHTIQVIASGPGFPDELIHQALLTSVYSAREQLIMTTPYFVPSDDLLHAICTAAQRGVDVSIIVPKKNDSMLVGWASRSFFTELLEAGVKIYQFEGGLLHTKSVLVDGQLSLVGTVNLDMRSLWLNFEITLVIDDDGFGADLACVQDDYIARSTLLDHAEWLKRPLWQRVVERLFYFFSPLL